MLTLPRVLSLTLAVCAYTTMVLGAYVKAIGAGMACPDWPSCDNGQFVPSMADPWIAAEITHRFAATLVALSGALLLAFLLLRHRKERALVAVTVLAAATLAVQIALGALTISSVLNPVVVTAHLAVATLFFGLTILVAVRCWRLPVQPTPTEAGSDAANPSTAPSGGSAQ